MQQVNIYTKRLKLQGYNITNILGDVQQATKDKNHTAVTQLGLEKYIANLNKSIGFTFTHQHFLNSTLDMLYVPEKKNYDSTYNIYVEKFIDSFRYQNTAVENVNKKICFLASNIIDEQCQEYHIAMKGDAGEEIDVVINSTAYKEWDKDHPYVTSIKIKTTSGLSFKHDTLLTFDKYLFSTSTETPTDSTIIIPSENLTLYSKPECDDSSLVTPEYSYYPQGYKYPDKTYYKIISKMADIKELIITLSSENLKVENFNTWLASKSITTTSVDPMEIDITNSSKVEQLYISPELKDINFKITKSMELYYPKPRLLNITIFGTDENTRADVTVFIDESYVDAGLERIQQVFKVNTINVKEIHLSGKYFDGVYISDASPGDFGSWENVKCDKLVFENIGQPTTEQIVRNVLKINNTNIPVIEFTDSN